MTGRSARTGWLGSEPVPQSAGCCPRNTQPVGKRSSIFTAFQVVLFTAFHCVHCLSVLFTAFQILVFTAFHCVVHCLSNVGVHCPSLCCFTAFHCVASLPSSAQNGDRSHQTAVRSSIPLGPGLHRKIATTYRPFYPARRGRFVLAHSAVAMAGATLTAGPRRWQPTRRTEQLAGRSRSRGIRGVGVSAQQRVLSLPFAAFPAFHGTDCVTSLPFVR